MFIDLISEIASDQGIQISIPAEREYLEKLINRAAKEVYNSNLLRGCEMEMVVDVDTTRQQISLPSYVGQVLNVKQHYLRAPINLESMRPRYLQQTWVPPYLNWRVVKFDAPLARITDQVAPLTLTLSQPAEEAFIITIAGRTVDAKHAVEQVLFSVGDTTHDTVNAFYPEDIVYIKKSRTLDYDLTITDLDGTVVAELFNNALNTQYMVVNILDWIFEPTESNNRFVEVLFKPRFQPYVNDTDVFSGGEIYERAVYYKTQRYLLEKQEGKLQDAIAADSACMTYLNNVANQLKSTEASKLLYEMPIMYRLKYKYQNQQYRRTGL